MADLQWTDAKFAGRSARKTFVDNGDGTYSELVSISAPVTLTGLADVNQGDAGAEPWLTAEQGSPGTPNFTTDVAVDNTATGVEVLAAAATRKRLIVQNTGANPVRFSIGSNPTATHGLRLAAGESRAFDAPFCPTGAVRAIREGGSNSTVACCEITA